jgi:hypothetical protein
MDSLENKPQQIEGVFMIRGMGSLGTEQEESTHMCSLQSASGRTGLVGDR